MTPVLLLLLAAAGASDPWTWWIQPCTRELAAESACEAADSDLAEWALDAWQSASGGRLSFTRTLSESKARLRFYWATGRAGLYGETRLIRVSGQDGAAVYVLPDLTKLGLAIAAAGTQDRLFRHAVVYLTFLHESGHALGHRHARDFDSIMYAFAYGGDILEYFSRYRRKLSAREDIPRNAGIRLGNDR